MLPNTLLLVLILETVSSRNMLCWRVIGRGLKRIRDHLSWHLAHKVKFSDRALLTDLPDAWIIYQYYEAVDIQSLKNNEFIGVVPELIISFHIHQLHALPAQSYGFAHGFFSWQA